MTRIKLHFSLSSPQRTRLMEFKYTMTPSNLRFTIFLFLTFSTYILSESIFLKYHYTLSLYKVNNLSIKKSQFSS
jgi:hypothetical protein